MNHKTVCPALPTTNSSLDLSPTSNHGQKISTSPQITFTNNRAAPLQLGAYSYIRVDSRGNITADARTKGPMTLLSNTSAEATYYVTNTSNVVAHAFQCVTLN